MYQERLTADGRPQEPKKWTVSEVRQLGSSAFEQRIMEESGFEVYFSNQGRDPKEDPLWNKRRMKTTGSHKCSALVSGGKECKETTRSPFGVCAKHRVFPLSYHPVDWVGFLKVPSELLENLSSDIRSDILGRRRLIVPMHGWLIERLLTWSCNDGEKKQTVSTLMKSIEESVPSRIPDATSLQEMLQTVKAGRGSNELMSPDSICINVKRILDDAFPEANFSGATVPHCRFTSRPKKTAVRDDAVGEKPFSLEIPNMPVRVVAAITILAMVAEEANRGDAWFRNRYGLGEPERAGAHFAYTVYVLRNEGRMSIKQICKLLQVPPWT